MRSKGKEASCPLAEVRECQLKDCDCPKFGKWGACSQSCGWGTLERTRTKVGLKSMCGAAADSAPCHVKLCSGKPVNWVLGYATKRTDVGEKKFNTLFHASKTHIIKRVCRSCKPEYREIFYRRYTHVSTFGAYDYMKQNWRSASNKINKDFGIFSSYGDALAKKNPWKFCNYDDPGVGFPRDCGMTKAVGGQWNSDVKKNGKAVAFYIDMIATTKAPTVMPTLTPHAPGRYKACPPLEQKKTCLLKSCPPPCKIGTWSKWSKCSKPCGAGETSRTRSLKKAKAGAKCPQTKEAMPCNTH